MDAKITITVVSNSGSGEIEKIEVLQGKTSDDVLNLKVSNPSSYTVTVNGDTASRPIVLQNGDRVTITPTKQAGAR